MKGKLEAWNGVVIHDRRRFGTLFGDEFRAFGENIRRQDKKPGDAGHEGFNSFRAAAVTTTRFVAFLPPKV